MLIDEQTGKRRGRRPWVGVGGRDVAVGLGAAWVAVSRQNALMKLDPSTGRQLARIALPNRPQTIAIGHGAVWVGMSTLEGTSSLTPRIPDSLARVDPKTNAVTRTYPMAAGIRAVVASPRGIWIVNRHLPTVSRFDPAAGKLDRRVILSDAPLGGAAYGSGALWVALPQDTVVRIGDKIGGKVSIGVGRHPTGVAARGKQIWVTSFIDHTLTQIDPDTSRTVGKPVPVPLNPYRLTLTNDSIWLTAVGRGEVARVRYRAAG
jgi:streptogramin lyase